MQNGRARRAAVPSCAVPPGGLSTLVRLLKAGDEVIVGNSALSLSHLCNDPAVCSRLADTDIVMTTLVTARDGRRHAAQNNCAVLIAKLARGDERYDSGTRDAVSTHMGYS